MLQMLVAEVDFEEVNASFRRKTATFIEEGGYNYI
jgi:hypothetical protein